MFKSLDKVFFIGYFLFFTILLLNIVGFCHDRMLVLPMTMAIVGLIALLGRKLENKNIEIKNKYCYIILGVVIVLMSGVMAYISYGMIEEPFTDFGTVYVTVNDIVTKGHASMEVDPEGLYYWFMEIPYNDYFVVYPNNMGLLTLLVLYYKFLSIFGVSMMTDLGLYMGAILNIVFINTAIIFGFFASMKIWDNKRALLFLGICFIFVPYYVHAHRYYTDSLSMPFVTGILLFYIMAMGAEGRRKLVYGILLGITIVLGVMMKGSVIILPVALLINTVLKRLNKENLIILIVVIISVIISLGIWNVYLDNNPWVDNSQKETLNVPFTHWIMMSLEGDGGYRHEDLIYTRGFETKAEKKQANIEEIKKRIKSYGSIDKFLEFEINKISPILADGTYIQENHLLWAKNKPEIFKFIISGGEYYKVYYVYITVTVLVLYFMFYMSIIRGIFTVDSNFNFLINLCIFGVILFFMMWEVRSRYLLNYTTIFIMCAINGMSSMGRFMYKKE